MGNEEKKSKTTLFAVLGGILVLFSIAASVYAVMNTFCKESSSISRFEMAKATAHQLATQVDEKVSQVSSDVIELAAFTKQGFRDIQLSRYQDELRKIGRTYGTTNCDKIHDPSAADYCRWLKDEINKLMTQK